VKVRAGVWRLMEAVWGARPIPIVARRASLILATS